MNTHLAVPRTTSEEADGYDGILVKLNNNWRVIVCAAGIQWILQRRTGERHGRARWEGRSFCRTREAINRLARTHAGAIDPAAAILAALPPLIGRSPAGNEQGNFTANTGVRRNAPATSSLNQENQH
jgi:hypothetical protein